MEVCNFLKFASENVHACATKNKKKYKVSKKILISVNYFAKYNQFVESGARRC